MKGANGGRQSTGGCAIEADGPQVKGVDKGSPNNSVQEPEPVCMAMRNYEKKPYICQLLPITKSGEAFRPSDF